MKEIYIILAYVLVCAFAASICVYALITDGWQEARSTIFWTIGIFGGVTLAWVIGNRLSK